MLDGPLHVNAYPVHECTLHECDALLCSCVLLQCWAGGLTILLCAASFFSAQLAIS